MKDIRKQRTQNYFIDAACEIIKNEGMEAATIRNIADKAGYNSATLYSYFDNLPHLLLCAHMRFEDELLGKFKLEIEKKKVTSFYNIWSHMYCLMAQYYLENPNVFDLAFVSSYGKGIGDDMRIRRNQESEFGKYVFERLQRIAKETSIDFKLILKINRICLSETVGMVLLSLKQRTEKFSSEQLAGFEEDIRQIIQCLVDKEKK